MVQVKQQVVKFEENLKIGESSPDPNVDEFLKHVEESKQKLEDNQAKLEEAIEQTTVEIKGDGEGAVQDEPQVAEAPKKGRDLKYLIFLIVASLMFVVAFGAIISYYIIAIESKLTYGEGTVVIYVYENGTETTTTTTTTGAVEDDGAYTVEPNPLANCSASYAQNLDEYTGAEYKTDEQHPWPWLATIEYSIINNQTKNQTQYFKGCGGAMIGENQILTAAHCVDQNYIQQAYETADQVGNGSNVSLSEQLVISMRVKVGIQVNSTFVRYETFYAEEVIKHPNYTTGQADHDLAVIRLKLRYGNDSSSHFCVMPKFDFLYVPANIYALAKANKSYDYSKVVQKSMNVYNGSGCTENSEVRFCAYQMEDQATQDDSYHYKDPNLIHDRVVYKQVNADRHQQQECARQTSGLPLMQQLKDSSWSLVGIGSFAQNPCSKFTIFTKLDAYKQWINDAIAYDK